LRFVRDHHLHDLGVCLLFGAQTRTSVDVHGVTLTATISNGLTGTITFYDGSTSIGTGTISGTSATFTTSSLSAGSHSISASWPGNTDYNPITSGTLTQTVNQPSAGIVYTYSATYDGDGNVHQYSDTVMGTWNFYYDDLNRLWYGNATSGGRGAQNFAGKNLCWAYDSFGNRTAQVTQTTACPSQETNVTPAITFTTNNQIAGGLVTYDQAGNVTGDTTTGNSYLYDAEGRVYAVLSEPVAGTYSITGYLYDAEGNRIAKGNLTNCTSANFMSCSSDPATNGFQITDNYVLGPAGEELSMLDGSNNWQRTNVYAAGKLVGTYDTNGLHFHLEDPLGTRRMQLSAIPNFVGQPETDIQSLPYGDFLSSTPDPDAPTTADDATPLHFTGKERDAESGNDYFGARYFSSSMGRFLSPDVFWKDTHVADPQSWNLYAYARNNPLRYTDPTGQNATVSSSCTTDSNNHTTCNVNVSASFAIYAQSGSGLSQDQMNSAASTLQSSIQNAWSGSFTQDGVSYNVSTSVSVSVVGSESDAMKSGAQNVIGISNGNASATADSYVQAKGMGAALFGGPDKGVWNINNLGATAAHEFTHLLGVDDRTSGPVLSNTNMLNDPSVPHHATNSDFQWGLQEMTRSVGLSLGLKNSYNGTYGPLPSPYHFSTTDNVGAPYMWWK
jgi:RHS repeat-associated protein